MKKILFFLSLLLIACPGLGQAQEPAPPAVIQEEDPDQEIYEAVAQLISIQLRPCWKIPAGSTDSLEAYIDIDPEGHMTFVDFSTEITKTQRPLAESVKNAIADPKCNPLKNLPPKELYYIWEKIALLFAPKK